ncbi:thermonuclease family protein [Planococcus ruber]|uniref:thermonuclease family protein n=1 Tax=Planococcus ruber TaxID=2027871 RepID=UPI001FEF4BBF|nr:thermonuclease family protein [Planococcus ruber]MCJ1907053.1 thermonuclease family protein [Planococcus ruber]
MKKLIGPIFLSLLLSACTFASLEEENGSSERIDVEVISVIDGDTIKINFEGKNQTVRYLLVDTPETNHPTIGKQPLGAEATAENKRIIESGEVSIEFDEGGRYDDYDRLLAYIYVDGESVQEQLLASGLARVAYIYPPNTRYVEEFKEVEKQAREKEIGIWEYSNYATDRGFNAAAYGSSAPSAGQSYDKKCNIKGNISRSGNKIYHMPGQSSYDQTNPEEWFCTEQEAQDAGFRSTGS